MMGTVILFQHDATGTNMVGLAPIPQNTILKETRGWT